MFAIVRTGGKQYKVSPGQKLDVELIEGAEGAEINLDGVLLFSNGDKITIGKPIIKGARIQAKILEHGKKDKVKIFKIKRRKNYKKSQGHRQNFTKIEIKDIILK